MRAMRADESGRVGGRRRRPPPEACLSEREGDFPAALCPPSALLSSLPPGSLACSLVEEALHVELVLRFLRELLPRRCTAAAAAVAARCLGVVHRIVAVVAVLAVLCAVAAAVGAAAALDRLKLDADGVAAGRLEAADELEQRVVAGRERLVDGCAAGAVLSFSERFVFAVLMQMFGHTMCVCCERRPRGGHIWPKEASTQNSLPSLPLHASALARAHLLRTVTQAPRSSSSRTT